METVIANKYSHCWKQSYRHTSKKCLCYDTLHSKASTLHRAFLYVYLHYGCPIIKSIFFHGARALNHITELKNWRDFSMIKSVHTHLLCYVMVQLQVVIKCIVKNPHSTPSPPSSLFRPKFPSMFFYNNQVLDFFFFKQPSSLIVQSKSKHNHHQNPI